MLANGQPPGPKPDPANPILNPPTLPGHQPLEPPPRQPNETPVEEAEPGLVPSRPGTPHHPLGPPEPLPQA